MNLSSYFPVTVDVGEEELLHLSIKKMSVLEIIDLRAKHRETLNAKADDEKAWVTLFELAFSNYVRIDELTVDGEKVTAGGELLKIFGNKPTKLNEIFSMVMLQSTLDDKKNSTLPSPTDSELSSEEPSPEVHGQRPETTVESVVLEGSARGGVVMHRAGLPSGSTVPTTTKQDDLSSSSIPVPSSP